MHHCLSRWLHPLHFSELPPPTLGHLVVSCHPWPWLLLLALILHSALRTGHRQVWEHWGTGGCWPCPSGATVRQGCVRGGISGRPFPISARFSFRSTHDPGGPVRCFSHGNLTREWKPARGMGRGGPGPPAEPARCPLDPPRPQPVSLSTAQPCSVSPTFSEDG